MKAAENARTVRSESQDADVPEIAVTAHQSSPGKVVFTEEGNTDAWIASDTTVSLE
jgi:hypothetical protein